MDYSFTFDPKKNGLRQILGDLEADIMETAWRLGSVTVRQVHESLNREREIAYTTIMTVMTRLADKGLLKKVKSGNAFSYRASVSKKDFTQSSVKKVMGKLLEDFTAPTMRQFVDFLEEENPDRIDELARIIEEKRKNKK